MMISSSTPLLLLLCLLSSFLALVQADHGVISSINDLKYDENGKVATHYLLYPQDGMDREACRDILELEDSFAFQIAAVSDTEGLSHTLFPKQADDGSDASACRAVCVERGADQSVAHAVMPHKQYNEANDDNFDDWFTETCRKVEICFLNYHNKDTPVQVYWVDVTTKLLQHHMQVEYGEKHTKCFHSFVGHEFQAQDGDTHQVLKHLKVEHATVLSFGENPACDDADKHGNFDQEITSALQEEWKRHSKVTRTFSPLGFAKGRLPDDVFASMGAFFYNNRHHVVREEWNGRGVFVNWWESDAAFVQIPWGMRGLWQERLKDLVEIWAGEPVEQTVMYGLRQYQAGARLLTHVDRLTTHAVSLIVNVAQGNLTEPWPVEVHDHADRLHEVIMAPGDIVYYESAKCLHGRNRPLTGPGAYYVNLFTHYRPVGDSKWYLKENPETTPAPVLEDNVEGTCRVGDSAQGTLDIAALGQVSCDDARLGSNLSPALFTATNANDLIDWWRKTAPPNFTGHKAPQAQAAAAAGEEL